jgi:shikimate kinase
VQRVSVVGSSGSGKTTVGAAPARRLGARFAELDSLQHMENWTPVDPDDFLRQVDEVASG